MKRGRAERVRVAGGVGHVLRIQGRRRRRPCVARVVRLQIQAVDQGPGRSGPGMVRACADRPSPTWRMSPIRPERSVLHVSPASLVTSTDSGRSQAQDPGCRVTRTGVTDDGNACAGPVPAHSVTAAFRRGPSQQHVVCQERSRTAVAALTLNRRPATTAAVPSARLTHRSRCAARSLGDRKSGSVTTSDAGGAPLKPASP